MGRTSKEKVSNGKWEEEEDKKTSQGFIIQEENVKEK